MQTPDYIEIAGYIDQTALNLQANDTGGEEVSLDVLSFLPHAQIHLHRTPMAMTSAVTRSARCCTPAHSEMGPTRHTSRCTSGPSLWGVASSASRHVTRLKRMPQKCASTVSRGPLPWLSQGSDHVYQQFTIGSAANTMTLSTTARSMVHLRRARATTCPRLVCMYPME